MPTPVYENHMSNLELVKSACKNIASHLQKDQLVILESTVNLGVSENVILPILKRISGLKCGKKLILEYFLKNKVKVIINGRNCPPKEKFIKAGIIYKGIGK